MNVENLVDTSLQKVGTEICHVMSMKYMGWWNVQLRNLWEKFPNWWGFICNVYLFNFKVSQLKILANKFEAFLWKVSFYRWNWWVTYFNSCSNNWWERLLLFIKKPFNFMAMGCWHKMYVLGL